MKSIEMEHNGSDRLRITFSSFLLKYVLSSVFIVAGVGVLFVAFSGALTLKNLPTFLIGVAFFGGGLFAFLAIPTIVLFLNRGDDSGILEKTSHIGHQVVNLVPSSITKIHFSERHGGGSSGLRYGIVFSLASGQYVKLDYTFSDKAKCRDVVDALAAFLDIPDIEFHDSSWATKVSDIKTIWKTAKDREK